MNGGLAGKKYTTLLVRYLRQWGAKPFLNISPANDIKGGDFIGTRITRRIFNLVYIATDW